MPIWRDANQLLVSVEEVVKGFARYHKYTIGTELRQQALKICILVNKAWRYKHNNHRILLALSDAIDQFKIQCQLAKQLHAYQSFAQFQKIAELSVSVGKQCGGWERRVRQQPEVASMGNQ